MCEILTPFISLISAVYILWRLHIPQFHCCLYSCANSGNNTLHTVSRISYANTLFSIASWRTSNTFIAPFLAVCCPTTLTKTCTRCLLYEIYNMRYIKSKMLYSQSSISKCCEILPQEDIRRGWSWIVETTRLLFLALLPICPYLFG